MTLADHERAARNVLRRARVDSPDLCARVLTARAAGLTREQYVLSSQMEMPRGADSRLAELVNRRAKGEPLAYILGEKEFYSSAFYVNHSTLVPRPETEGLVEIALTLLPPDAIVLADLGCGSGCIGLSLLLARPKWRGILVDNSPEALNVATANGQRLRIQCWYMLGDIFRLPVKNASLDLVICNPPYIGEQDRPLVMGETLAYEPSHALFSGNGGTAHLAAAVAAARRCLKPAGLVIFEHGLGQGEFMSKILAENQFTRISEKRDLAGIQRYSVAYKGV